MSACVCKRNTLYVYNTSFSVLRKSPLNSSAVECPCPARLDLRLPGDMDPQGINSKKNTDGDGSKPCTPGEHQHSWDSWMA